jgi:hypothetical protein
MMAKPNNAPFVPVFVWASQVQIGDRLLDTTGRTESVRAAVRNSEPCVFDVDGSGEAQYEAGALVQFTSDQGDQVYRMDDLVLVRLRITDNRVKDQMEPAALAA